MQFSITFTIYDVPPNSCNILCLLRRILFVFGIAVQRDNNNRLWYLHF